MIAFDPIVTLFFLVIWIVIGMALGWLTGLVMTWFLRRSKAKIVVSLVLGGLGCLTGVFISGWAAERSFNSGVQRSYFIWDEGGKAVDLRTALAEHQNLVAILGAILLVMCWHFVIFAYRVGNEKHS